MAQKFTILTLFPEVIQTYLGASIPKRARDKGLVEYNIVDIRQFGEGLHKIVDDRPFGGGAGMVLKADILASALKASVDPTEDTHVILTSASGALYNQAKARSLVSDKHIVLICGHYEGVDQRFIDKYVDEEISVGDYVLTGGELPALTIIDSIVRLIPGVLEKEDATLNESFSSTLHDKYTLVEYPHYTRPQEFEGESVPEILTSGDHKKIDAWRKEKALERTKKNRPDLIK